ncbi:MAG: hypothetical protein M3Q69_09270 [Acidobacteriota bacterium]|nr:hypothetical protein [Acidobacteriota bacterium]
MRFVLVLLATLLTPFPASAIETLRFGRDVAVAPPEYADPALAFANAEIATDGDGYLAVWSDNRRSESSVFAARLTADGTLLDKTGIYLGRGNYAGVVWSGASYVVAWDSSDGLHVASVQRDGRVSGGRTLFPPQYSSSRPALASDGKTIGIGTTAGTVFILGQDLSVLVSTAVGGAARPMAIAAGRGNYLLARINSAGLPTTQLISESGATGPIRVLPTSHLATGVSVATDGSSFYVVWTTEGNELRGQFVSLANEALGESVLLFNGSVVDLSQTGFVSAPDVAWNGSGYVASFLTLGEVSSRVNTITVRTNGQPASTAASLGSATGFEHPGIATKTSGGGAVVWRDDQYRVRAGIFTSSSIASANPLVTVVSAASAAIRQSSPVIVEVNRTAVLAWAESSGDVDHVRVSMAGQAPLLVADESAWNVDVLFDGQTVAVVWQNALTRGLRVRRYTAALEPIDAAPLQFALPLRAKIDSATMANGVIALTWRPLDENTEPDPQHELYLLRLVPLGDTLVRPRDIELWRSATEPEDASTVLWDGTRLVVVWRHRFTLDGPYETKHEAIFVQRFALSGAKLDAQPIVAYESEETAIYALRAATRNGRVIIGWQELPRNVFEPLSMRTYVARFEGGPLSKVFVESRQSDYTFLQAIAIHPDNEIDLYWWASSDTRAIITARRLTPQLLTISVVGTDPFLISHRPYEEQAKTIVEADFDATVIGDAAVFIYGRLDDDPAIGGIDRVFVRGEIVPWMKRRAVR